MLVLSPGGPKFAPLAVPGPAGAKSPNLRRAAVPRFVDLSTPIVQSPEGLPDLLRTDIAFAGHAAGAQTIETMFGVGPELLAACASSAALSTYCS